MRYVYSGTRRQCTSCGYAQVAVQWISSLSELPQTAFRKSVSEHTVLYGVGFCLLSERAGRTNCLARCSRADSWGGGWPPSSSDCSSRTSLHLRGRRHASGAVSATQRILRSCSGASGARWERPDESFVVVRPQGLAWMRCGYLAVDFVCAVPFARSRAEQGEESCSRVRSSASTADTVELRTTSCSRVDALFS